MTHRSWLIVSVAVVVVTLILTGRPAVLPREPVPDGWALDVHQPGEWWTQPLIPRSVVVQRCPPPPGWPSDPNLALVTGLPPGASIEYFFLADDYHCDIGWSQPASPVTTSAAELATEAGLRRYCSASGLPMDAGWRYLGKASQRVIGNSRGPASEWPGGTVLTAAFVDHNQTVATCLVGHLEESSGAGGIELRLDGPTPAGPQQCPVRSRDLARSDAGTVDEYQLRGAGSLRDLQGRVLTEAATVQFGLAGDTVTTTHPVEAGSVIVDVAVTPAADIHFEWNALPAIEGHVFAADGTLLATCRS